MRPSAAFATIALAMFARVAVAQPAPVPNSAIATPGERVTVTVGDGRQITGRFQSLTPESLALLTQNGVVMIPSPDVRRVIVKDPITNGVVIGAVIGVAGGLTGGLFVNAICLNETGACPEATMLLAGIGAGAGALLGAGVDGLRHRTTYDAIPSAPGEYSPELGANAGIGWVSADKLTGGAPGSVGVSWSMRHTSGWGFTVEANHSVNSAIEVVKCTDTPGAPGGCEHDLQRGVEDSAILSGVAQYHLSTRARVRPYLSIGAAAYQDSLKYVETLTVPWFHGPLSLQQLQRHQGVALAGGGGARIAITGRVAARGDLTVYRSRDWTHVRVSAGLGFGW